MSPVVAVAIHEGHELRPEVAKLVALGDLERRREEDGFTGYWASVGVPAITVHRSRFEVDLNRPRDAAVYLTPEQAFGLSVWSEQPSDAVLARSRALHAAFYERLYRVLDEVRARYGYFVVLDLHTYNHRRRGPLAPCDAPELNPDVNVGTGTMPQTWRSLVNRFVADLRRSEVGGRTLDVRENVRFRGGYLPTWVHQTFPGSGCALAIEIKKFFMDEWSGGADLGLVRQICDALAAARPGLVYELDRRLRSGKEGAAWQART
jgi:N-formylglutamate amidohydrolase